MDIDTTGTSPLYLVENRAHMPSGYDAENIWSFLSKYNGNFETGKIEKN